MSLLRADARAIPLADGSVDAIVTDPPYGLEFMGKEWDRLSDGFRRLENLADVGRNSVFGRTSRTSPEYRAGVRIQGWHSAWATEALRVLKPAHYMLAFGGTRTYHRLACAVEDAGFEIRDCLMWLYGSGFPKGKGCLKPAYEPILLCRKPGPKVGELGIEGCRIPTSDGYTENRVTQGLTSSVDSYGPRRERRTFQPATGRWPANIVHDGSEEVVRGFPVVTSGQPAGVKTGGRGNAFGEFAGGIPVTGFGDSGSAARFFYCAKASRSERESFNDHPTVKPLALMRWLVCLVCPPGGIVLDPFCGSGSTITAAREVGREGIGMDLSHEYLTELAGRRIVTTIGLPL